MEISFRAARYILFVFVLNMTMGVGFLRAGEHVLQVANRFLEIQRKVMLNLCEKDEGSLYPTFLALIDNSKLGDVVDKIRIPQAILRSRIETSKPSPRSILVHEFLAQLSNSSKTLLSSSASEEEIFQYLEATCKHLRKPPMSEALKNYDIKTSEELEKEIMANLVKVKDIFTKSQELKAFYDGMGLKSDVSNLIEVVEKIQYVQATGNLSTLPLLPAHIPLHGKSGV